MLEYPKIYDLTNCKFADRMPSISVTSVGDSDSIFCMDNYNPFITIQNGHRSMDAIKKELDTIITEPPYFFLNKATKTNNTKINIRVGDPLLHPQIFDILKMIRGKFPKTILTFVTIGEVLSEEFIEKLSQFNPIIIHLSLSTTCKDQWLEIYNKSEDVYFRVMNSIKILLDKDICVWPLMIPMINKLGFSDIENTFKTYRQFGIDKLFIINPAYSKYTPKHIKKYLEYDEIEYVNFIESMIKKYQFITDWFENPSNQLVMNYTPIINKLQQLNKDDKKSYWFTSIAAYERFSVILNKVKKQYSISIETEIVKVENRAYGGNINCSSLWMVSDIKDKIEELGLVGENVIIPNTFFDEYGFDRMGENIQDYFKVSKNQITILNLY